MTLIKRIFTIANSQALVGKVKILFVYVIRAGIMVIFLLIQDFHSRQNSNFVEVGINRIALTSPPYVPWSSAVAPPSL